MWIRRYREPLFVVLLGVVLAAWLFHPAIVAPTGHAVGREQSEQLVGVWANQVILENLVDRQRAPHHVDGLNFEPGGVVYPMSLPTALLALPFYGAFTITMLYNAAMLLNFLLSLLGAYLLFRHLGAGRPWAALPGALLYALAPYCLDSFAMGPMEATALGWIPLAILAVERLDGTRPVHHLVRAGALALVYAGNPYYGVFTLGAAGFLLLTRTGYKSSLARIRGAAPTLAAAVLLMAPMAWYMMATLNHPHSLLPQRTGPQNMEFHAQFLSMYQAVDLASLVLPTSAYQSVYQHIGFYLGLSALLACGLAVARAKPSRRWLWLGLGFLLFSLGGGLRIAGWQAGGEADPLRLPAYWLLMYVPGFSNIFYPYRAMPLVMLCMGAMVTLLLARPGALPRWAHPLLFGALFVADMLLVYRQAAPLPAVPYQPPDYYLKLGAEQGNFGVLDLPPPGNDTEKANYLLHQRFHRKRIPYTLEMIPFWKVQNKRVNHFVQGIMLAEMPPNHPRRWDEEAKKFECGVDCAGLDGIWKLGIRDVVLHRTRQLVLDNKLTACLESCPLTLRHKDNQVRVYRRSDSQSSPPLSFRMGAPRARQGEDHHRILLQLEILFCLAQGLRQQAKHGVKPRVRHELRVEQDVAVSQAVEVLSGLAQAIMVPAGGVIRGGRRVQKFCNLPQQEVVLHRWRAL